MSKFTVGARVGYVEGKMRYSEYDEDNAYYGVITDILNDGRLMVKWDDEYMNRNSAPMKPNVFELEGDLKAKYSALEEAFNKVQGELKQKMKEAGDIITSASKLADEAGFELTEMYEVTRVLERAMEGAGWQTSSWHC